MAGGYRRYLASRLQDKRMARSPCSSMRRYSAKTRAPSFVNSAFPPSRPPRWVITSGARKQRFIVCNNVQARM